MKQINANNLGRESNRILLKLFSCLGDGFIYLAAGVTIYQGGTDFTEVNNKKKKKRIANELISFNVKFDNSKRENYHLEK